MTNRRPWCNKDFIIELVLTKDCGTLKGRNLVIGFRPLEMCTALGSLCVWGMVRLHSLLYPCVVCTEHPVLVI